MLARLSSGRSAAQETIEGIQPLCEVLLSVTVTVMCYVWITPHTNLWIITASVSDFTINWNISQSLFCNTIMLLLRLLCGFNCGVLTKVMCVVVCVTKFRVPLGAPPPSWWVVYLLLVIFAALPVVVGDNLGRQTCPAHVFMWLIRAVNCHLCWSSDCRSYPWLWHTPNCSAPIQTRSPPGEIQCYRAQFQS